MTKVIHTVTLVLWLASLLLSGIRNASASAAARININTATVTVTVTVRRQEPKRDESPHSSLPTGATRSFHHRRSSSNVDPWLSLVRGGGAAAAAAAAAAASTTRTNSGSSPTTIPPPTTGIATATASASLSTVRTAVVNAVVSGYLVATETATKHILPALKDPYHNVWIPTVRFLREQEAAAIEQRWRTMTMMRRQIIMDEEARPAQPTTTVSSATSSSTASRDLWSAQQQQQSASLPAPSSISKQRRRNNSDGGTQQDESSSSLLLSKNQKSSSILLGPSPSPSLLLLPVRLCKLSLAAWLLAEALDRIGILHEETPAVLRLQLQHVWYDNVQPHLADLPVRLKSAWHRVAPEGIQGIPTKYQFAIGAGVGMAVSQPLAVLSWTALTVVWQPTLLVYGLAELHARLKEASSSDGRDGGGSGGWNLLQLVFNPAVADALDRGFDHVRHSIRRILGMPIHHQQDQSSLLSSHPTNTAVLGTTGGTSKHHHSYPQQQRRGMSWLGWPFASSSTTSSHKRTKKGSTILSSWRKNSRDASSTTRSMTLLRRRTNETTDWEQKQQQHRFIEMLRHGFLVGGVVGLLGGL
jgi:hypothetical protein